MPASPARWRRSRTSRARHGLLLIEDAAQALGATYRGRPLGGFGQLAALSFHETKNLISGEGGALLVNAPELSARAEIVREKGTNRGAFFRGEVDKYTWVDIGSSFLPSDIIAAFLWAQLEHAEAIARRAPRAVATAITTPSPTSSAPAWCGGRSCRAKPRPTRTATFCCCPTLPAGSASSSACARDGVHAVFHYVPLHDSPAGPQVRPRQRLA